MLKSRARSSPNEDIERDFRALFASVAGARALGSTFRRSRDVKCQCSHSGSFIISTVACKSSEYFDPGSLAFVYQMSFILVA